MIKGVTLLISRRNQVCLALIDIAPPSVERKGSNPRLQMHAPETVKTPVRVDYSVVSN